MPSKQKSEGDSSEGTSIHSNILKLSKDDVFEKYQVVKLVGEGSMGSVSKVRLRKDYIGGSAFRKKDKGFFGALFHRRKKTGKLSEESIRDHLFALKSILVDRVNPVFLEEMNNEIMILRECDHTNIVKLYEVYRYKRQIYLLMELCDGGDLYTRQPYSERESARITAQLCSAVKYMHDHGVVHRDLKLENIMFENKDTNANIKIIDYGLSKRFKKGQLGYMHERVGTIYTMAPQVLQGIYSSRADMWAVGVIAYALLSSSKPFYHKYRRKMIDLIMRADYNYDKPIWSKVSDGAKDFIDKLLVIDPKSRMGSAESLKHPWLVHREQLDDEKPTEALLKDVGESLLHYKETSLIKKLALNVIAHRSSTKEISDLRRVFDKYDVERDGTISFQEFQDALREADLTLPEEDLKEIFDSIDVNKQGKIYWTEFLAATIEAHGHIAEDRIAEAFDRLDSDDSGYISKKNVSELLGSEATPKMVDDIIKAADTDNDGKISYQEFLEIFRKSQDTMVQHALRMREPSMGMDATKLVGLDAKIPGGIGDDSWIDSVGIQDSMTKNHERLPTEKGRRS